MSIWHLFQLILLTNLRCKYFSYFTETLYNLPKAMQLSRNLTSDLCKFRILSFPLSSRVSICLCCSDVSGWLRWQWKGSTTLRKAKENSGGWDLGLHRNTAKHSWQIPSTKSFRGSRQCVLTTSLLKELFQSASCEFFLGNQQNTLE